MKIIKYFFEFIIVITLFIFFKLIGKKNASDIGCNLARLLGSLFRSTKKIKDNLNLAFPKLNQSQQKKIINDMWCNFGRTFAEYVFLNEFQKKTNIVKVEGMNILHSAISSNKPTVFISGHFANFELMAMELEKNNANIAAIYRPLNNKFLNPVMEYWRKKFICPNQIPKNIPGTKNDGTRQFIKAAKNNMNIAVMVDQSITQGKRINFFKPSNIFLSNRSSKITNKHDKKVNITKTFSKYKLSLLKLNII